MIAIITGDIIGATNNNEWLNVLKNYFNTLGENPTYWDIYRGDEFQVRTNDPQEVLKIAFTIKALLIKVGANARMSIGIGSIESADLPITQSMGTAFINSGRNFDGLKKLKTTLLLKSDDEVLDISMNLLIKFALTIIDHWTASAAEVTWLLLNNASSSQNELANQLGIAQSAVSQRLKSAHYDLIMELNEYYIQQIKRIC